jgi:hypothetical protein
VLAVTVLCLLVPAKAGTHQNAANWNVVLDSRLRGNERKLNRSG